jgi:hypothetical protein
MEQNMTIRRIALYLMFVLWAATPLVAETWYVRTDGGSRYSAKVPTGQCDGKSDVPYRAGDNRHCAFNDYRYLWDDHSYGNSAWVIAGGDTVILRRGPWRVGFDSPSSVVWCFGGQGPYACSNPTIPAGSATRHTRILGENYANCSTGPNTNHSALTQIFGGFGVTYALNLSGAQNVDVQCLEITEHNGKCVLHGSPAYPKYCNNSGPGMDDYDANGISMDDKTANVLLQDVWVHGHTASGIHGPIGGAIALNRVNVSFNGFAGWNFDNGSNTPDAPGSSINASYVTMIGNGCNEEYPIVHAFPALSCYDLSSGGFGDSWSGQDTTLASFTCDHCLQAYNTKDGFIGPHTQLTKLTITNSMSYGNMGQQWKWGATPNSTTVFENNLTIGNCRRMSAPLPGAPSNYNQHLSLYCRAAGDIFSFYGAANSTVLFTHNTTVGYSATMYDLNCQTKGACKSTKYIFRNNIMLGFINPKYDPTNSNVPGLYYLSDSSDSVTTEHNVYFDMRIRGCLFSSDTCADPLLVNEPPKTLREESDLDSFNFHPRKGSPAIEAGTPVSGVMVDYYNVKRLSHPTIGAVEP